jgi:uncharacterized membrane protein YfcA
LDPGYAVALVLVACAAGALGGMLGLGGGVLLVPLLTLFFHQPIQTAIGASVVAVIVTSGAGASVYLKSGLTNVRLGLLLQVTTAAGAVLGSLAGAVVPANVLFALFGIVVLYTAVSMFRSRPGEELPAARMPPDPWRLGTSYFDPALGRDVAYVPRHIGIGTAASVFAGVISGLLGIGGGPIQVPIMRLVMGLPIKAAVGTSNFLVGTTVVASAFIYYARGYVDPVLTVPTAFAVFFGAQLGSRVAHRINGAWLSLVFAALLGYLALEMLLRAFDVRLF